MAFVSILSIFLFDEEVHCSVTVIKYTKHLL